MSQYEDKLSAFLDGELPEDEAREIEQALAENPALQDALETLMIADQNAEAEFAEMLSEPVPEALVAAIEAAPERGAANLSAAPSGLSWLATAATLAALAIGIALGYFGGQSRGTEVAAAPRWLSDIADYHAVYASQKRHLVEVPASEAEHIQTWLSNTLGADVRVPDLSNSGLTFEGARLLVAAGKPVAQLMYRDAEGRVVALCQIQSDTPRDGFSERTLGDFDMVSWGGADSNFVIVGDGGRDDLSEIAMAAADA